jgi:hypothetical protein
MSYREIRLSLYGVVAGIILGTGALSYAQHVALQASSAQVNYLHAAPRAQDVSRRSIEKRGPALRSVPDVHSYPTLKDQPALVDTPAAAVSTDPVCDAVRAAVAKIRMAYESAVPNTVKNTDMRKRLDSAFASALAECMQASASSSSVAPAQEASEAIKTVNNRCEQYPRYTARYSQCVIAEQHGKKFP